jgi:hypothetical protein
MQSAANLVSGCGDNGIRGCPSNSRRQRCSDDDARSCAPPRSAGAPTWRAKHKARASDQRAADEAAQDDRISQLEQQQAPPPQAAPAAGPSMADQLQQIAALHQQGALTDDEFAAAKSKLLGG